MKLKERLQMNAEEWAAYSYKGTEEERKVWEKASKREIAGFEQSLRELREERQYGKNVMGGKPIIVIKGNTTGEVKKVLDWAEERRTGTEEQRALIRRWLGKEEEENRVHRDQLRLTSEGAGVLVHALKSGNDVQLTEPDLIAWEVKKIFDTGVLER
jgi:hypothetical protein